jgi:molybdate transport system regulatory protein
MSTRARKGPAASPPSAGIRFRVDFHDRCSVGIGKISLLEAIAHTGSLSQAARALGMSYRRAWLLVDSMNAEFDTPVTRATVGGSGGGGAQLTSFGQALIHAYRGLEARLTALTVEHMSEVMTHVLGPRTGPARRQKLTRRLT